MNSEPAELDPHESREPLSSADHFETAGMDYADAIIGDLAARSLTLAVAESCTGGLVTKQLTDPAGASAVLVGGVVAYANSVKKALLGVRRETLARYGAVSRETAREMAVGVRQLLKTDCSISVTGIAGPTGGSAEKPVGTVWIGATLGRQTEVRHLLLAGNRHEVREGATRAALALLWSLVQGGGNDSQPPGLLP